MHQEDATSNVDGKSIYRIGSISKVFVMLSMMVLRDSGKLNLDDEISNYVPEFKVKNPWSNRTKRGITFRQLATHLSGISRESPCTTDSDGGPPNTCDMDDTEVSTSLLYMQHTLSHSIDSMMSVRHSSAYLR